MRPGRGVRLLLALMCAMVVALGLAAGPSVGPLAVGHHASHHHGPAGHSHHAADEARRAHARRKKGHRTGGVLAPRRLLVPWGLVTMFARRLHRAALRRAVASNPVRARSPLDLCVCRT